MSLFKVCPKAALYPDFIVELAKAKEQKQKGQVSKYQKKQKNIYVPTKQEDLVAHKPAHGHTPADSR